MASKKEIDYQELSNELDAILVRLEATDLNIDEALKNYQRGMAVVELLEQHLATAENKIIKVKAEWDNRTEAL